MMAESPRSELAFILHAENGGRPELGDSFSAANQSKRREVAREYHAGTDALLIPASSTQYALANGLGAGVPQAPKSVIRDSFTGKSWQRGIGVACIFRGW